jgi:hypothetical protein
MPLSLGGKYAPSIREYRRAFRDKVALVHVVLRRGVRDAKREHEPPAENLLADRVHVWHLRTVAKRRQTRPSNRVVDLRLSARLYFRV